MSKHEAIERRILETLVAPGRFETEIQDTIELGKVMFEALLVLIH